MTSGLDYPDFQNYPQWRGGFTSKSAVGITSGSPEVIGLSVNAYASTLVTMGCTSGTGVTVTIHYYTDATMSVALGSWTYIVLNGGQLFTILPNTGNYLEVVISTSQSGTQNVNYAIQTTNIAPTHPSYPVPTNYEGGYSTNIPASSSFTFTMPQTMEGNGQLVVNPRSGGTTMAIVVNELTESGSIKDIVQKANNPGAPISLNFLAGRNPIQVEVDNNGTSTHAIDWSCNIAGR